MGDWPGDRCPKCGFSDPRFARIAELDTEYQPTAATADVQYIHQLEGWLAEVRERSEHLLKERNALLAELAALRGRRCHNCKSWDDEDVEEVAAVRFSWCKNGMATKEFKSVVVSEGWLCPLWAARAEEGRE